MKNNNYKSQFKLRKVMNSLGVSDAELGRRLGVTRQAVNKVVNGHTDITLSRLHEYADALGVRVCDLFE